jgi:hemerythrin-like metal-binding protein
VIAGRQEVSRVSFIEWSPRYDVNVTAIDEQHRRLVEMINELYVAMVERRASEAVRQTVDQMVDYARDHFALEEAHMADHAYPEFERHRAEHARFTRKAAELQARLAGGTLVLSLEVISYLRDWLTNHIVRSDKQLGSFLNGCGVK